MTTPLKSRKKGPKPGKRAAAKAGTQDTAREKLLAAGKRLFAKKGLDGVTVKDLAKEAGVNVSLVSYYYSEKEGLYEACLRECGQQSLAMAQRLLAPPSSVEDFRVRLGLFVDEMHEYFSSNRDHVRTLLREVESEDSIFQRDYKEIFEDTFLKSFVATVDFFKAAQKAGIIRKNLDPHLISGLFRGAMSQTVRCDFLGERYFNVSFSDPKHRAQIRDHLLEIFLHGILTERNSTETLK